MINRLLLAAVARCAILLPLLFLSTVPGRAAPPSEPVQPFFLRVLDQETGRGVPLVELRTTSEISSWTDSAGVVAFLEPGLMDRDVFFEVRSHGYEFPADGFGFRGRAFRTTPGQTAELKVQRLNIAERLYRVTGQGIYRDTLLAGLKPPILEPVLNGHVMGQDTVVAIPFQGRLHWFWGDTERPGHPLGHFGASGAVSDLPKSGGLDPSSGINLRYYTNDTGFSRPVCPDPPQGMRWLEGLMTVPDPAGRQQLVARYAVMKDLGHANEWVLGAFDTDHGRFDPILRYNIHTPHTSAHPFRVRVGDEDYWYLYPTLRVRANWHSVTNPSAYESFTCLNAPADDPKNPTPEKDLLGRPIYRWRPGFAPFTPDPQQPSVRAGSLPRTDHWHCLTDVEKGTALRASPIHGSVCWNTHRRRWVGIFSGEPGDIWFAEADTPVGPWVYARRILAHDRYNFYNPTQHPFFDQEFGRVIYFEGTYTTSFSSAPAPTPRYDYNQIMYRLTFDDPRLSLPAPVYELQDTNGLITLAFRDAVEGGRRWHEVRSCQFSAWPPDRRRAGLVPLYAISNGRDFKLSRRPIEGEESWAQPFCYVLDPDRDPTTLALDGFWRCLGDMPSGTQHDYGWELHTEGESVMGRFDPDSVFRVATIDGGTFRNQELELKISHAGARYLVNGQLKAGRLSGRWKRLDEEESGTWSGTNVDPHPRPQPNPAVIPLFEYVHTSTGRRLYRTSPNLDEPSCQRTPSPLGRVLMNPQHSLILDPEARPAIQEP